MERGIIELTNDRKRSKDICDNINKWRQKKEKRTGKGEIREVEEKKR